MPRTKKEEVAKPNEKKIIPTDISEEMRTAYIDYAMSVITDRALPDVRDGLKPVQRRILYAIHEMGAAHNSKTRKSARIVGEVIGKYHPHGNIPVYSSMVKMAQNFGFRYPLIIGQGNFGSLDGDGAAAERYTEAKGSLLAAELVKDIEQDTVDWVDNYEGTTKEPINFPSRVPNILLNGTLGIAVGMTSSIPPHNLREVTNALLELLQNKDATNETLLKHIQGPDFPVGGVVHGKQAVREAYSTGRGSITVRGEAEIMEEKKGIYIHITSIPFRVTKAVLIQKIAQLVRDKKIEGIKELRDESTSDISIVVELKNTAQPQKVLNRIYKYTQLEDTYSYNMNVLVNGQPRILSLKEILEEFLKHRRVVVKRRSEFILKKARARKHILEGLLKAVDIIDMIIKTIRASKDVKSAHAALMKKFKFSAEQTTAILEMRLQKLAGLELKQIQEESEKVKKLIEEMEGILKSKTKVNTVIKKELNELANSFGDDRRTRIVESTVDSLSEEDLIPDEQSVLVLTQEGYVKRTNPQQYKRQHRGGVGVIETTKTEDVVTRMLVTSTHSTLFFFTDKGKVYGLKMYEIPEGKRSTKGKSIANFLSLTAEERITSVLAVPNDKKKNSLGLFIATKKGIVKKMNFKEFSSIRQSGLIAVNLSKDDSLIDATLVNGKDELMLFTKHGKSIRFKESDVRQMGRTAAGVKGVTLEKDDVVVSLVHIPEETKKTAEVTTVSSCGYGKRTPLKEYRVQSRGGRGIKAMRVSEKTGTIVAGFLFEKEHEGSEAVFISKSGQVIKILFDDIPTLSRQTQGVRVMRLRENDRIASSLYIPPYES